MFARVATFEGDQAQIRQMAQAIGRDSESGPPEGVPGKADAEGVSRKNVEMFEVPVHQRL